ncbi:MULTISPECIES: hypothetical protein [unclassified Anaeromyxobacter]|uniref:hypothetical protein n=1 Tax=unclassified Anaeromyxobacter TaxID=2620896 RepID=UPI001F5785FF|nr:MULTISPECIES: hypothetical protein [unclassified Anaeromyxobacter]
MAALVPGFVWPIVIGVDVLLIAFVVLALRRYAGRGAAAAGVLLGAWLLLVAILAATGAFAGAPDRPPRIGLAIAAPILAGGLALLVSRTARARALAIPQAWVVGIQSLRLVGFVFLVLYARGGLPGAFALPAGFGDVAVGAAAPLVAYALATGRRHAPRLAVAWNVAGLLDLVVAVGAGALSAPSSIQVFTSGPSSAAMAELPLSLVPTFGVPLFVLLHAVSLLGLRARGRARAGRAGTAREATPALAR